MLSPLTFAVGILVAKCQFVTSAGNPSFANLSAIFLSAVEITKLLIPKLVFAKGLIVQLRFAKLLFTELLFANGLIVKLLIAIFRVANSSAAFPIANVIAKGQFVIMAAKLIDPRLRLAIPIATLTAILPSAIFHPAARTVKLPSGILIAPPQFPILHPAALGGEAPNCDFNYSTPPRHLDSSTATVEPDSAIGAWVFDSAVPICEYTGCSTRT
jgi:hypothetical protein